MSGSALVSVSALSANLGGWRLFDCRHDLMKPELGEAQYRKAHLPGALFAHLDRDLSAPKTGRNGRHPLPEPQRFIDWLGQQGLKREHQVVCYDAGNGTMAARLWWMLRWVGHEAVAVLDGGIAEWLAEGKPVTADIPSFEPTRYPGRVRADYAVNADYVAREGSQHLLLDARAPARHRGEQEPIDAEPGRIPGSINRFCGENLTQEGFFKERSVLRAEFTALLGPHAAEKTVHYCGSGVAACHNLLAMEIAGLPGGRLYPGSWSEWIADPRRPRERG
jgi:thiosulfate/3-mercaptopyruvate sulfurtransferase